MTTTYLFVDIRNHKNPPEQVGGFKKNYAVTIILLLLLTVHLKCLHMVVGDVVTNSFCHLLCFKRSSRNFLVDTMSLYELGPPTQPPSHAIPSMKFSGSLPAFMRRSAFLLLLLLRLPCKPYNQHPRLFPSCSRLQLL